MGHRTVTLVQDCVEQDFMLRQAGEFRISSYDIHWGPLDGEEIRKNPSSLHDGPTLLVTG
jgi:hypothetical protein